MSTPITLTGAYTCGELSCEECNARTAALIAERDQLRVDLELADVMYQRECEVEHELRTEVERLRADRTYNHECINRLASATGTLGENSEKVVDVVLSTIAQLRAEVRMLRAALESITDAWRASHETNPFRAGDVMLAIAEKALGEREA